MYDIADKIDILEQPELRESFSLAANEFANESYDKGQRLLEKAGVWNDELRSITVDANQADRGKTGTEPLTFQEAESVIDTYARNLAESGDSEDKRSALQIESIVSGMDRPGRVGIDGIDEALRYIEGVLQTKVKFEQHMNPALKKQWEEQRAVRDALFVEKKKRFERLEQTRRLDEKFTREKATEQSKKANDEELARIRNSLNLETKQSEQLPQDRRGLYKYFKDNFGKLEGVSFEDFRRGLTSDVENKFQAWAKQNLDMIIKDKPRGARYPDTVASVLGNDLGFLQRLIAVKEGRVVDYKELLPMSFSEAARKYLNLDLPKDYFDHFSPR